MEIFKVHVSFVNKCVVWSHLCTPEWNTRISLDYSRSNPNIL